MKIYSMTATFGKLSHETLTLTPGLNIIEAPNEWGKSTWCAFLTAMLYGIDTRERSKGEHLADKERYAPWSGAPMSGRMDICWNGRDITIERSSKGRTVFGVFRAYETATGLDVPELTAVNCGQVLLGVEKSVFLRAGFLKLADLPVTQDESLRRRLNALVTTGDESGASDELAQKLRNLKNQCKSNSANGLIPKAETQKAELESKLRKIAELREQSQRIQVRQESLASHIEMLQNHQAALEYAAAQEYTQKAAAARLHLDAATDKVHQLSEVCQALPSQDTLQQNLYRLQQLREQKDALQMELQLMPAAPTSPEPMPAFRGCTPEQATEQAKQDKLALDACQAAQKKPTMLPVFASIVLAVVGLVLLVLKYMIPGLAVAGLGLVALIAGVVVSSQQKKKNSDAQAKANLLLERYRPLSPDSWVQAAQDYAQARQEYEAQATSFREDQQALRAQIDAVAEQLQNLTCGVSYLQAEQQWKSALEQHKALADAIREQKQTEAILQSFGADRPLPQSPKSPDNLRFTQAETTRLLADAEYERHQLQLKLGNAQGQMESFGREEDLVKQLDAVNARLSRLEDIYSALEIAQSTLQEASKALQRRFAPRISKRAQELFGKLTGSRYDRLTLGEDLSLSAGAQGEDTLHESIWRSDGTVDQLYLALRLAVAEELTPEAPLVLDDALVRFDDTRLEAAMQILAESSEHKQVILFTCQSREKALYND